MKVKELKEMLKKYGDNVELVFISEVYDRDGFPCDYAESGIYKVLNKKTYHLVKKEYGIKRYED